MRDEDETIADSVAVAPGEALPAQIGPYQVLGLLGEGAMGRVYRARESQPPREVALKVMHALGRNALTRFRREVELLAQLEHPGIARLYAASDAASEGQSPPWLALEYVRGHDLLAHATGRELGLDARLQLLVEICRAVHYAHGRGVIHRDLKPGNILVDASGPAQGARFRHRAARRRPAARSHAVRPGAWHRAVHESRSNCPATVARSTRVAMSTHWAALPTS